MKNIKKIIVFVLLMALFTNNYQSAAAATDASDGANMKKVLQYCAKGSYKKAKKYGKKLSKTAKEACVKKMSSKMKKAYRKVVKKYPITSDFRKNNGRYMWDYYLTDIDNDKKADLLIQYGSCEADVKLLLYQYKKGKAVKVASTCSAHSCFSAYPNHSGIIRQEAHMGDETVYILTLKNGKIKSKLIYSRYVEASEDYLTLNCSLKSHVSYKNDKEVIAYNDLK